MVNNRSMLPVMVLVLGALAVAGCESLSSSTMNLSLPTLELPAKLPTDVEIGRTYTEKSTSIDNAMKVLLYENQLLDRSTSPLDLNQVKFMYETIRTALESTKSALVASLEAGNDPNGYARELQAQMRTIHEMAAKLSSYVKEHKIDSQLKVTNAMDELSHKYRNYEFRPGHVTRIWAKSNMKLTEERDKARVEIEKSPTMPTFDQIVGEAAKFKS